MKYFSGRIIKAIGGFYYVDTAEGIFECRGRGIFRKNNLTPLVGDIAEISIDDVSNTGFVDKIQDRKNVLLRPPVSNVDQMAVVVSTTNPKPNKYLLDTLLASAEYADITPLICFNKTDLDQGDELFHIYQKIGFNVVKVSAKTNLNIDIIKEHLKDKITVFAGNSGVGKSSILNAVLGKENFETGEVSTRVERGKHTTRHNELVALDFGGYIIDTPGFGSFDIAKLEIEDCTALFREFSPFTDNCKFTDCSHTVEKGCAVLEAIHNNQIDSTRHESYCRLVNEIKQSQKWK